MKQSEFKRSLAARGATFVEGKKHKNVSLNGKQKVMPRHPSAEIGETAESNAETARFVREGPARGCLPLLQNRFIPG